MNRREAYRVLCVAPSADAELVERAYRHLARKYRAEEGRDGQAKARLDELKEAYSVLAANGAAPASKSAAPKRSPSEVPEPSLLEAFILWIRELAASTAARWEGHVTEISVLTACLAVLAALALLAGADLLLTMLVAAVAAVAIWSPWRRLH